MSHNVRGIRRFDSPDKGFAKQSPGLANCGWKEAWEWSVAQWPSRLEPRSRRLGGGAYTVCYALFLSFFFLYFLYFSFPIFNTILGLLFCLLFSITPAYITLAGCFMQPDDNGFSYHSSIQCKFLWLLLFFNTSIKPAPMRRRAASCSPITIAFSYFLFVEI